MLTAAQSSLLNRMKSDIETSRRGFYKPSDFFWKRIVDDFENKRRNLDRACVLRG